MSRSRSIRLSRMRPQHRTKNCIATLIERWPAYSGSPTARNEAPGCQFATHLSNCGDLRRPIESMGSPMATARLEKRAVRDDQRER